jgi:hypothetical protein
MDEVKRTGFTLILSVTCFHSPKKKGGLFCKGVNIFFSICFESYDSDYLESIIFIKITLRSI